MSEKSILIIDDDQALVDAMKEGLEGLGYRVSAAYDGLQGILQAHQDKPDAIMLDFNMPAGGGAGVYERLRGSGDTGRIPIIFLTGATVDQVKGQIRSTPNTYFLKKPVGVAQMQKVLEKIMGAPSPLAGPPTASGVLPLPAPPAPAAAPAPAPAKKAKLSPAAPPPAPLPSPAAAPVAAAPPIFTRATVSPKTVVVASGGTLHSFDLRVGYSEVDRLGVVYYAHYLKFFEEGRTELLRSLGLRYRDLENERKIFLPAVEARCEYLAPSRYDDELTIKSWLSWMGPASVCFQHEICDKLGGRLSARGFSRHAVVDEHWKPVRIPKDLRALLAPHLRRPS